eukprot:9477906-Lingulodinium_polyedra.AAC.1
MADEESSESISDFWPQLLGQHGEQHGNQPKGGKAVHSKPPTPKASSKPTASSPSSKESSSYYSRWLAPSHYPSPA